MNSAAGGPRRATIYDVAAAAGVSRATVSRAINGESDVSAATREAVARAVTAVGYSRNTAAHNLKARRTSTIGMVVHEPHARFVEDPNIAEILLGANDAVSAADLQLVTLVIDTARDSKRVAKLLSGGFVDGAVFVSARATESLSSVVSGIALPAAYVGRPPGIGTAPFVSIDNRDAAREITSRLLGTGRRRVGMLVAGLDRDSGRDRVSGFQDALGDAFDSTLVIEAPEFSYSSGVEAMRRLLERAPDIDGIFAASDAMAAGAIEILHANGRSVPDDVGVVGFDDSAWATRCSPALSTVHQPARELGRVAAERVLERVRGEDPGEIATFLPTRIVWRQSA